MEDFNRMLKYGYYNDIDEIREKYLKSKGWKDELIQALFRCELDTQTEIIQAEILKELLK